MAVQRIIGIDFGTSTSVIRVKRYENGKSVGEVLETKEVIFGGNGALVPTLVMKKDDDPAVCYYGYEAQQKKKKFTSFQGFKMDLESEDPQRREQAKQLTEEFYGYLARQYQSQSNGGHLGNPDDREQTVISYPVKWTEQTKRFMLDTARKAGFPNVTGMDEAQAAIQAVMVMSADHLQKNGLLKQGESANILLIDMGAGTTDLVLARYTPGENAAAQVLNTWPKSGNLYFGGQEVDTLLQSFFRNQLEEEDAERIFRRIGADKFKSWKEEMVSPALAKMDSVRDFEVLDSCAEMMGVELEDYCLNRSAFEKCLEDYLKQFPRLINGCLEEVSFSGSDVDLVIVTGGHSQWYFVGDMLCGKLPQFGEAGLSKIRENPARIIPISRPQETVALGLAYSGLHPELPVPETQDCREARENPVNVLNVVRVQEQRQTQYTAEKPVGTPRPEKERPYVSPVAPRSASPLGIRWNDISSAARATAEEARKSLEKYQQEAQQSAGGSVYTIPRGKTVAGTVYVVKSFFASKKMEYQYFCKDNCHVIQARNHTSGIAKLAGGSRAVEIRLTPMGDNRVLLKVGGGKWVDKAAGAILSTFALGPLVPIGVAMYGANLAIQVKLLDDVTKAIERYLSC